MTNELIINKRFFRPDEVAEILLITRRTVYRMVHDGRLGGVDFTKRPWRIPREAVLSLFAAESFS
jgi:excisionase family DNA binding protein